MLTPSILSLTLLAGLASPNAPQFSPDSSQPAEEKITLLVNFLTQPGETEELWVEQQLRGTVKYNYSLIPAMAIQVSPDQIEAVVNHPGVFLVEPDGTAKITNIDDTWGVKAIGGGLAHNQGFFGDGVVVGLIDTGIDYSHPELSHIYLGGYDFVNDDADPMDDNFHGTHVSGTIAAKRDGVGVVGVAPNITMWVAKGFSAAGSGAYSDLIACVEYVTLQGCDVVNNSWGGGAPPWTMRAAFEASQAAGVIHICAAGNNYSMGGVSAPGRYDSTYCVTALESIFKLAGFSDTGKQVDFSAPGVDVLSCDLGGGYTLASGTSMAAPHVVGVAALALATGTVIDQNGDGLLWDELYERLALTAVNLGPNGKDKWFGHGMVNAQAATSAPMILSATAFHAGSVAGLQITNATPGDTVTFTYSISAPNTFVVPGQNILMGIGWPIVIGSEVADASGSAVFSFTVPMSASGLTARVQAVETSTNTSTMVDITVL